MTLHLGREVSGGALQLDRWVDLVASPFITAISAVQDGQAITLTGTAFSGSGNSVWAGSPSDAEAIQIGVATEGTTSIVTNALSAIPLSMTSPTTFFVRNALGVASNVISATIAPVTGRAVRLVDQAFLGSSDTRVETDPPMSYGDELEWDSTLANVTGQGAVDVPDSTGTVNFRVYDGDKRGDFVPLTFQALVTNATVPNVVNQTLSNAQAAIQAIGLLASVIDSVPSTTVAAGNVISQFPTAGQTLPLGGTVELTLSLGVVSGIVPNVVGLNYLEAQAILLASGYPSAVNPLIDGNNSGLVVEQSVLPGTVYAVGLTIELAVSLNVMPDLVGLHRVLAEARIAGANLVLDPEVGRVINDAPIDTVLEQSPAAGEVVVPLQSVTITVSAGGVDTASIVPYLIGDTEEVARQRIEALYCVAEVIGSGGSVLAQSPAFTTPVFRGSTIQITMGGPLNNARNPRRRGLPPYRSYDAK